MPRRVYVDAARGNSHAVNEIRLLRQNYLYIFDANREQSFFFPGFVLVAEDGWTNGCLIVYNC